MITIRNIKKEFDLSAAFACIPRLVIEFYRGKNHLNRCFMVEKNTVQLFVCAINLDKTDLYDLTKIPYSYGLAFTSKGKVVRVLDGCSKNIDDMCKEVEEYFK
jgi:hypothetical protein